MRELEEWLRSFVLEFRDQYDKLPESTKKFVSNLDNFNPPCQIIALWIEKPQQQHIFVTRDPNRPDLDIIAEGPISPGNLLEVMESLLEIPWLNTPIPAAERFIGTTYARLLEGRLLGIANLLRYEIFAPQKEEATRIGTKTIFVQNGFQWIVTGILTELNPHQLATDMMAEGTKHEQASLTAKPVTNVASEPEQPSLIEGHGTFFYPPIWVGKLPTMSLRERFFGFRLWPTSNFSATYKTRNVLLGQNGYIAIGERDKTKCTRLLNEIMGAATLLGLPAVSVREDDMGEVKFQKEGGATSMTFPSSSERSPLVYHQFSVDEKSLSEYREVSKEQLLTVIQAAEKVTREPANSDYLVFLLEAHTLLENSEYMQSFIMSWLVLERYITKLWEQYLAEGSISGERKRKLTNPIFWSIDNILETLNLSGKIASDEFKTLMRLKNKRNDITHEGTVTTQAEAIECISMAESVVRKELGLAIKRT